MFTVYWNAPNIPCEFCGRPNHSCRILDPREGKTICTVSGIICSKCYIVDDLEVRSFANDNESGKKDRKRAATHGDDDSKDLSSMIDKSSKEGKDLARVQIKSMKTSDRGLANGLSDIREYGFSMSLSSSMIEKAQEIFGEAIKLPEFKSNERTLFISSALFFACRHAGVDRSINEICRFTKADEHKVGKMNSRLRLCDSILPLIKRPKGSALAATKSSQFINRFCSHLKLDARFASYAFGIATRLEEATLLEGRNPSTLAAACILIAVNEKKRSDEKYSRSAADIARVAGVSEASVKKAYKDLMPSMHLLI